MLHRKGNRVDVEALHGRFPLRRSADEGSNVGSRIQKVAAVELGFRGAPGCFQGMRVYKGEGSTSVEQQGPHKGGGRAPTLLGTSCTS